VTVIVVAEHRWCDVDSVRDVVGCIRRGLSVITDHRSFCTLTYGRPQTILRVRYPPIIN